MTRAVANTTSDVGASLLRKEDARHLRGRGQFVSDVQLPHTQDVAFVRSPHAHAPLSNFHTVPSLTIAHLRVGCSTNSERTASANGDEKICVCGSKFSTKAGTMNEGRKRVPLRLPAGTCVISEFVAGSNAAVSRK